MCLTLNQSLWFQNTVTSTYDDKIGRKTQNADQVPKRNAGCLLYALCIDRLSVYRLSVSWRYDPVPAALRYFNNRSTLYFVQNITVFVTFYKMYFQNLTDTTTNWNVIAVKIVENEIRSSDSEYTRQRQGRINGWGGFQPSRDFRKIQFHFKFHQKQSGTIVQSAYSTEQSASLNWSCTFKRPYNSTYKIRLMTSVSLLNRRFHDKTFISSRISKSCIHIKTIVNNFSAGVGTFKSIFLSLPGCQSKGTISVLIEGCKF